MCHCTHHHYFLDDRLVALNFLCLQQALNDPNPSSLLLNPEAITQASLVNDDSPISIIVFPTQHKILYYHMLF